jgi:CubicO group peptidase (beta-lactamase class C family)
VPAAAVAVAEESFAELGLPGLVLAGASAGARPGDGSGWAAARGWASLDGASPEEASLQGSVPLTPDHRFPAYSVTKLITATVVLRLAAGGQIGLDDPARAHLHTIRLADETITVRDLLIHTSGVQSPGEMFADRVPDLVTLVGPVVPSAGPRGTFSYSNGGYALLGQLVADVTGGSYPGGGGAPGARAARDERLVVPGELARRGRRHRLPPGRRRLVRDGPSQDLHRPGGWRDVDDRG